MLTTTIPFSGDYDKVIVENIAAKIDFGFLNLGLSFKPLNGSA